LPVAVATARLKLGDIHCHTCAATVVRALATVPGTAAVWVRLDTAEAGVRYDPGRTERSSLVEALRRAGYDVLEEGLP
jgi:copper chaperone CopZ